MFIIDFMKQNTVFPVCKDQVQLIVRKHCSKRPYSIVRGIKID